MKSIYIFDDIEQKVYIIALSEEKAIYTYEEYERRFLT